MPFLRKNLKTLTYIDAIKLVDTIKEYVPPSIDDQPVQINEVALYSAFKEKSTFTSQITVAHALTTNFTLTSTIKQRLTKGQALSTAYKEKVCSRENLTFAQPLSDSFTVKTTGQFALQQDHFLQQQIKLKSCLTVKLKNDIYLSVNWTLKTRLCVLLRISHSLQQKVCLRGRYCPTLTQAHLLNTPYRASLLLAVPLRQAHALQYRETLTSQLNANLIDDEYLSSFYTLKSVFSGSLAIKHLLSMTVRSKSFYACSLSQNQRLKSAFFLTSVYNGQFKAGHPLVFNERRSSSLKAQLTAAALLKQNAVIQGKLVLPLRQAHKLAEVETLTGVFNPILRVKQPLKISFTGTSVTKSNLQITHALKQATTLSSILTMPLKQGIYLRSQNILVSKFTPTMAPTNSYEPETVALLLRMNPIPSSAQRVAINSYIKNLKASGVWPCLDFLYIFAAANTLNANLNWVGTAFPATLSATAPAFTAYKGYTFSTLGNNIDTGLTPATGTHLYALNSAHLSVRVLNSLISTSLDIGNSNSGINSQKILNSILKAVNGVPMVTLSLGATGSGIFTVARNDASNIDFYANGSGPTTSISPSTILGTDNIMIGNGLSLLSNRQIAFASGGSGLTSAQAKSLHKETDALLTSLGAL